MAYVGKLERARRMMFVYLQEQGLNPSKYSIHVKNPGRSKENGYVGEVAEFKYGEPVVTGHRRAARAVGLARDRTLSKIKRTSRRLVSEETDYELKGIKEVMILRVDPDFHGVTRLE